MADTYTATVIPAKAGIQAINNTPHAVGQQQKHGFVRYAELFDELDSGLRRNDEWVFCVLHYSVQTLSLNYAKFNNRSKQKPTA